ncbi:MULTISPECIES: sensor histidine kinase [unclassified Arenibacter]|uniref:sensor histidine kinase n=1 Tax=unclassified Arenibacter TaxID=2615047 RepID=UPI000E34F6B7|nr:MULTISPECIES: histidine kinase [unclassified Arenibacter]MCM4165413.1 histidine kinase [Arenibacter sp. A80]RFT54887.1 histidine kinase [Arenibacter sp. P308M17]
MQIKKLLQEKGEHARPTIPRRYHIIFWIIYFTFNSIRWGSYFGDYWHSFKSNLVEFPLHIIIVYFNIYYLVPKFIIGKKYKTYLALFSIVLAIHYFVRIGLFHWLIPSNTATEVQAAHGLFSFNHIVTVTLGEIYVIGLVSAIKFTIDYVIELNKNNLLLELQSETEMKYLKAQIQPHFFFNTLNNLYALTLKRSKKAAEVVLKLSEIMEYMIYDLNKKKISLRKEINYVENYIELERIRKKDLVTSNIEIIGQVDDVMLPPFLFLPFVENCFKHGQLENGKIFMEMKFIRNEGHLEFYLKNDFEKNKNARDNSGIGLINIKRRLELLYGNQFELENYPSGSHYIVVLKIPIK